MYPWGDSTVQNSMQTNEDLPSIINVVPIDTNNIVNNGWLQDLSVVLLQMTHLN